MKVIAFYLPQYYAFPENDKWWGKGFTEWTNVRKSKPLYKGHWQPTVPLNGNYYSLEDIETMKWQAGLAREYGIYGFCFYHYWFGKNRKLMEKPVEQYLAHPEIDFPYCLCWANHNWSRTWVGGEKDILMDVYYGDEQEWEQHFQYLLPYLKDTRYIRIDGKPVLVIYQPQMIPCRAEMIGYLQKRSTEEGLPGLTIVSQALFQTGDPEQYGDIDYRIQYEPNNARIMAWGNKWNALKTCPSFLTDLVLYKLKGMIKQGTHGKLCKYRTYSYDAIWQYMLRKKNNDAKAIAGAFVKCDVTPRRQERALIYKGATPEKFGQYMKRLVRKVREQYRQQIIFVSAWNEWGEGMYLEPDEQTGYAYLEGVKNAVQEGKAAETAQRDS